MHFKKKETFEETFETIQIPFQVYSYDPNWLTGRIASGDCLVANRSEVVNWAYIH